MKPDAMYVVCDRHGKAITPEMAHGGNAIDFAVKHAMGGLTYRNAAKRTKWLEMKLDGFYLMRVQVKE